MYRIIFNIAGASALLLAAIGVLLPLLPTVPLVLLAAFCFARGNPKVERWLLEHPQFGPHITAWREHGSISRHGKRAALVTLGISALIGLFALPLPWSFAPLGAAIICGVWIISRPTA